MQIMQLDHVVIFVPRLAQAISQFSALGFDVLEGGQHESTENALIVFEDQTYIELLALKPGLKKTIIRFAAALGIINAVAQGQKDLRWRLLRWVGQDYGSIDWCLRVQDIDAVLANWSSANIPSLGSQPFSRKRLDGSLAEWRLGSPKDLDLPFLLSDLSDRELRVPPPIKPHPNGALGIQKLYVSTKNLKRNRKHFDHCFEQLSAGMASGPIYKIADQQIELVGTEHHLGKFALTLHGSGNRAIQLDPKKTFGVSISLAAAG